MRLAGGLKFFSAARCPTCLASVDPNRTKRVMRWLKNLRKPVSKGVIDRGAWWGTVGYLALALVGWVMISALGDRWWPATVLLFGPRWVLLLPLIVVVPLAALRDRSLLFFLVPASLLVLGPVVGYQTGWRSLFAGDPAVPDLRVVSFNAEGGGSLVWSPANLLAEWEAEIVAFQECDSKFASNLGQVPGWHVDARAGLCLASRFEIIDVREMDREALEFAGGSGRVVTYELDFDGDPILVTNLHLETPRAGFELIRSGRLTDGIAKVREKSLLRRVELRRAKFWTELFHGPHIVTGDFNTPVESRSYREFWDEWQNSYSLAGSGIGGTRLNGWIRVRIDHILANSRWTVVDAWLKTDVGSDHLPIAARLRGPY